MINCLETLDGFFFSLWDISKPDIVAFFEQANLYLPLPLSSPPKFGETMFLDTVVYKGTRVNEKAILDLKTHFKQKETFQHTHFPPCHPLICQEAFSLKQRLRKVFHISKYA